MEIWTEIPGWKGYEISNLGNARSWFNTHGEIIAPHPLKLSLNNKGRPTIRVRKDRIKYTLPISRTVLETFIGKCPIGMQCCHYDDNPLNNKLENLRWDTHRANIEDAQRNGVIARGERSGTHRLTNEQVIDIRNRYAKGEGSGSLAKDFGVSYISIRCITSGDSWKHIGGPIVPRVSK